MPALGLVVFLMFPLSTALPLYSFVLLFSVGFYYLVFDAMRARVVTGKEGMIGNTCHTLTALEKKGKVTYGNEVWFAESASPVGPGEAVRIIGLRDLVLLVEPATGSVEVGKQ
jgi:membrane-bound ClpP family serine protease